MGDDLRKWMDKVAQMGQLKVIQQADWDLEIGCLTALNWKKNDGPALLFDNIKGYPAGYRVLTSSTSNCSRVALTLGIPTDLPPLEMSRVLRQKLRDWQSQIEMFPPEPVKTGPVLENVQAGNDVDLFQLPAPKWHEQDGGRYIGTADAVVTRDPDTGELNVGTYRVMVSDKKTVCLHMSPGKHGRLHLEKYHAKGEPCPVAISIGHHPLIFRIACIEVPTGSEYSFMGAVRQEPIKVIREEITGLPIPADSEIVIVGWCAPGETRAEGPFGEWTGYYASKQRPEPAIDVVRLYHRNNPIILGSQPGKGPNDSSFFITLVRSALLHNELEGAGVPDVKSVWCAEVGLQLWIIISIKQRYAGHAKQAALLACQLRTGGAYMGRYVIVVDDDIDVTNMQDVLWALCTRSDPEKDIDIIRKAWSSPLDPTIRKPADDFSNSRAIIDACKPYAWIDEFPQTIEFNPELVDRVKRKWPDLL